MDTTTKAQIERRVTAFTMYRNHVGESIIRKMLNIGQPTLKKWMREDEWETRRAALLQMEAMPGWASDLLQLLALQSRRLASMEEHLVALGPAAAQQLPVLDYGHLLLLCEDAQQQHTMLGVSDCQHGDASATLRAYAQQAAQCYYVPCVGPPGGQQPVMGRVAFVQAILESMGLEPAGAVDTSLAAIAEHLNELGAGLLLFDNADYLTDKNLLLLLRLHKATEGRVGMVLVATHLQQHLVRLAHLGRPGFADLQHRIVHWHAVGLPMEESTL